MRMFTITDEELGKYLNSAIELAAHEMVRDGLIEKPEQVTDRYLALCVKKNGLARMFEYLFKQEADENTAVITVVRIDRAAKAEPTK